MKARILSLILASNLLLFTSAAFAQSVDDIPQTQNQIFIASGMGDLYIAGHDGYAEAQDQATSSAHVECAPLEELRVSNWIFSDPQRLGYSYVVRAEAAFTCKN